MKIKTTIDSKGRLAIPSEFLKQMQLTGKRQIEIKQRDDGTVVIRSVRSIMHLAGTLKLNKPLLSAEDERRTADRSKTRAIF
jgi:bifunctional DNA-binding transcriptional regulator/antitoxin component of YhaV-PrlF toxin-antitoxin module